MPRANQARMRERHLEAKIEFNNLDPSTKIVEQILPSMMFPSCCEIKKLLRICQVYMFLLHLVILMIKCSLYEDFESACYEAAYIYFAWQAMITQVDHKIWFYNIILAFADFLAWRNFKVIKGLVEERDNRYIWVAYVLQHVLYFGGSLLVFFVRYACICNDQ